MCASVLHMEVFFFLSFILILWNQYTCTKFIYAWVFLVMRLRWANKNQNSNGYSNWRFFFSSSRKNSIRPFEFDLCFASNCQNKQKNSHFSSFVSNSWAKHERTLEPTKKRSTNAIQCTHSNQKSVWSMVSINFQMRHFMHRT